MIVNHVAELIGNTPLFKVPARVHGIPQLSLYAKLEFLNPFGSIKDRVAWGLLKDHIDALRGNGRGVIEVSSGNTAKAIAAIAATYGVPFKTITNRVKVSEVRDILSILGATVEELPGTSECPDPSDPHSPIVFLERALAASNGSLFNPDQYSNPLNSATHEQTTAQEILHDLDSVDYLIGGLGTAGSTTGVGTALRKANPSVKVVGMVARSDDFLPGVRRRDEMLEVGIFDSTFYDSIVDVSSERALDAMMRLIRQCGLLVGPSTGGSLAAVEQYFQDHPLTKPATAVFFACDRVEWYMSYIKKRRSDLFAQPGSHTTVAPLQLCDIEDVPEETPETLEQLIKNGPCQLVDIRHVLAFRAGSLPGAVNILDAHLEETLQHGSPFATGYPVVLLCRVGTISRKLAAYGRRFGSDCRSLRGGLVAWSRSGRVLTRT